MKGEVAAWPSRSRRSRAKAGAAPATSSSSPRPTRRSAPASASSGSSRRTRTRCARTISVNEGGGDRVELGGRSLYLCATAEKMTPPFQLRVHGRSGHASMPGIADNALVKAAPLIERLGALRRSSRS